MPRDTMSVQSISRESKKIVTKATVVAGNVTNGIQFPAQGDGAEVLEIDAAAASGLTLTFQQVACSHGRAGTKVIAVAASESVRLQGFDDLYKQADGNVFIDLSGFSGTVTLTITRRS